MIPLSREGPETLSQQIREWMRGKIHTGEWPEHFRLKSEMELASELGVNRGTLRKAMAALIRDGLLVTVHGRGTFVASKTIEQPLAESLVASSEDLLSQGIQFVTRDVQHAVIEPSPRIASLLSLKPGSRVFYLERVRVVGGSPLMLLHNYVAHDYCQGIERVDFAQRRLFQTLESDYRLQLAWGRRTFQAQVADDDTARWLEVQPQSPIMYMQQITYLADNSPVELSDMWLRGDRMWLSAMVKRGSRGWSAGWAERPVSVVSVDRVG